MTCLLICRFKSNLFTSARILIVITLLESALFSDLFFDWTQIG